MVGNERSGFEPWPWHCVVFLSTIGHLTIKMRLSVHLYKSESVNLMLEGPREILRWTLGYYPIQG